MKKILIIDDDPDILEAIQMVLASEGYVSEVNTKGEKTYDMVRSYKPNLIILDILLSGNDGRIICANLKKEKDTKKIPIIMISAHPLANKSVKQCGADSFVAKPFSIVELLTEVKKYFN